MRSSSVSDRGEPVQFTVSRPDLSETIPRDFTCDGANRAPRLEWSEPPAETRELAIEILDHDASCGTFTHWLVYGVPAESSGLARPLPAGVVEGTNDFGHRGYGGPCPPRGPAHHYHISVLALDSKLVLPAGLRRAELESKLRNHVLGRAELVATYKRA